MPVKYEQVVFCRPSNFQLELYRLFIKSPEIQALLRGHDSQPLKAINILKKLCNHPELLDLPNDLCGSDHLIPEGFNGAGSSSKSRGRDQSVHCEWGGKFLVLERFASTNYSMLFFAYSSPGLGSFIVFGWKQMTRLCLLVIILKPSIFSSGCAEARSSSLFMALLL